MKLTQHQMEAAVFTESTRDAARTEECTVTQLMADFEYTPEHKALYAEGVGVLANYTLHMSKRSRFPDQPGDNQIVTDSGYIATSPAYRLVTFVAK